MAPPRLVGAWLLVALTGCGPTPRSEIPEPVSTSPPLPAPASLAPPPPPVPVQPPPPAAGSNDAPEISRSVGVEGGVVVFWPRVIPRSDDVGPVAGELRKQLEAVVGEALPGRAVDVRPEPERVCPRTGCAAMTVGVLLAHNAGGCAAVALVSGPGKSETRLVPWAGKVELKAVTVPFRDHPESQVTVRDMVPCTELVASLAARRGEVVEAIRATGGR